MPAETTMTNDAEHEAQMVDAMRQGQTAALNMLGHGLRYDAVPRYYSTIRALMSEYRLLDERFIHHFARLGRQPALARREQIQVRQDDDTALDEFSVPQRAAMLAFGADLKR